MSKIDLRKNRQYFKNRNGLNNVYVYKNAPHKGKIQVGINGTSYHYICDDRFEAEETVFKLINIK